MNSYMVTTLSLDKGLVERSKRRGWNISFLVNEMLRDRLKENKKAKEWVIEDYRCHWCEKPILDEVFYYCIYHHNVFCEVCATYDKDIPHGEASKCRVNYDNRDCIWEKKEIILKEVVE